MAIVPSTQVSRQIGYIGDTRSDIWIARETGIPRSTLGYVRRGERRLPAQYRNDVRNLYQREAYRRMREIGVSRAQARRFQWRTPNAVRAITQSVKDIVNRLTEGRVIGMIANPENDYTADDFERLYMDTYDYVRDAMRKSPKTFEDWEEYEPAGA